MFTGRTLAGLSVALRKYTPDKMSPSETSYHRNLIIFTFLCHAQQICELVWLCPIPSCRGTYTSCWQLCYTPCNTSPATGWRTSCLLQGHTACCPQGTTPLLVPATASASTSALLPRYWQYCLFKASSRPKTSGRWYWFVLLYCLCYCVQLELPRTWSDWANCCMQTWAGIELVAPW